MNPDKVIEYAMKAQGWLLPEENPIPIGASVEMKVHNGLTYYKIVKE